MIDNKRVLGDYLELAAMRDEQLQAEHDKREADRLAREAAEYERALEHILDVVPELREWRARRPVDEDSTYNSRTPEVIFQLDLDGFTATIGGSRYGRNATLYVVRDGDYGREWVVAAEQSAYIAPGHSEIAEAGRQMSIALAVRECYREWSAAEEREYKKAMREAGVDIEPPAEPEPAHVHDFHARLQLVRYCYCGTSQQEDSWTALAQMEE